MVRPRDEMMLSDRTSAGRSSVCWRSIANDRCTASAVSTSPRSSSVMSSSNSLAARSTSARSPEIVISLPRPWMSQVKASSMRRSSSSLEPSSATMLCAPGTTIRVVAEVSLRLVAIVESSLTRWPPHWASAENVQVSVEDRLVSVRPGVGDQAVALAVPVAGDALALSHLPGHREHGHERVRLGLPHRSQVRQMGPRDDEDVGGRGRVDVAEAQGSGALRNDLGRDLA